MTIKPSVADLKAAVREYDRQLAEVIGNFGDDAPAEGMAIAFDLACGRVATEYGVPRKMLETAWTIFAGNRAALAARGKYQDGRDLPDETLLEDLHGRIPIGARVLNTLRNNDIETVGEFRGLTVSELLRLNGMGKRGVAELMLYFRGVVWEPKA